MRADRDVSSPPLIRINARPASPAMMRRLYRRIRDTRMRDGQRATPRTILFALAATGMAAAGAHAAEPWEQVLAQQLDLEQKCVMTGTYNVQEWPLGSEMVLSGKARCYDGREFNFSQKKNHLKFDIKACEPTIC
jgi:hypothetical protein